MSFIDGGRGWLLGRRAAGDRGCNRRRRGCHGRRRRRVRCRGVRGVDRRASASIFGALAVHRAPGFGKVVNQQPIDNAQIADIFDEVAELLEFQGENPFRVRSYRRAAAQIRDLGEPAAELYRRLGEKGLRALEGIGEGLAASIIEIVETRRLGLLTRLRAEVSPVEVFANLPGIGEVLAQRIVDELEVESLEELEQAVHDGRLETVPGIGMARAAGIGHALAGMLNRGARRRARRRVEKNAPKGEAPSVAVLLSIDAEYRRRARAGTLRTIAPRRFNPEGEKWLPIMEVDFRGRHYTVLYSNTRLAHELGRNHDWVIIYVDDGAQYTVVTATSGPLRDKRVVRGREAECRRYYERRRFRGPTPGMR